MSINSSSNLPEDLGITDEMMACPLPRIPFVPPENIPKDLEEVLSPVYNWSMELWGTVPRFLHLLANAPPKMEAWMLLDQKLRTNRLKTDPDYIRHMELCIVKTALLTECNN